MITQELTEKEKEVVVLICDELTTKEIAYKLGIPKRTVEKRKETIFFKLDVKSSIGIAVYGVKNGIYKKQ